MDSALDALAWSAEEMRRTGYATVDALAELLTSDPAVIRQATPAQMLQRLGGPAPEIAEGFDRTLQSVVSDVLPLRSNVHHPGYFAYIPGSGTWPGALGDLMASAMNLECSNWMESAGPSTVELQVLDWFRKWIGYPEGVSAFRQTIQGCFDLAALAEQIVRDDDRLELMMSATLGVVCFRRRFDDAGSENEIAARNAGLVASLAASGIGMVSSTRLRGRYAIRFCVLNHSSSADDVRRVIEHLAAAPEPPATVAAVADYDPERVQTRAPQPISERPSLDRSLHSLLAALTPPGLRTVQSGGREVNVPAGGVVVRRWAPDRDFYLVLAGELVVDIDGSVTRRLTAGDFFGELAAKDWGAGFGYPRLATITAESAARLWQIPTEVFVELLATEAAWQAAVDDAVRERLPAS